jgi:hypothetical protein
MSTKKALVFFGILVAAAVVLTACASGAGPQGEPGPQGPAGETGPQGPAGPAAEVTDLSCTECHNDTTLITSKEFQWEESVHANGTAAAYAGDRAGCAGCHSGGTFSAAIAAGEAPGLFEGLAGSATTRIAAPATRSTPPIPVRTGPWKPLTQSIYLPLKVLLLTAAKATFAFNATNRGGTPP